MPDDAFQKCAFASAVGADDGDNLADLDAQGHAEQGLEIAVEGVDAAHLEQGVRHRRRSPYKSRPPAGFGSLYVDRREL